MRVHAIPLDRVETIREALKLFRFHALHESFKRAKTPPGLSSLMSGSIEAGTKAGQSS